MSERFMIIATLSYLTVVFFTALYEAYWPRDSSGPHSARRSFYILFLQWLAILSFLVLSHGYIYALEHPLTLIELINPYRHTLVMVLIGLVIIAIHSIFLKTTATSASAYNWWSPVPLVLAIISSLWLSTVIADVLGTPLVMWPDWRFICVSIVVYVATLVLSDMFLFLGAKLSSPAWHQTVAETTRMCALLPALLLFLLGLRIQ